MPFSRPRGSVSELWIAMNSFLIALLIVVFWPLLAESDPNETVTFGRFGTVVIYHDSPHPSQVMLLISGEQG